ncbi:hypothetical protein V1289_002959 [Bradyrhizobium sp. AZCC 2289]
MVCPSYGVARQRDGRAKTAGGFPACFHLARGCRTIWRGVIRVYGFGGAMLLDRIGPPGRCRGGVVRIYWFRRPRVNLIYHPLRARGPGRGLPELRGRSPTRWARQNSRGLPRVNLIYHPLRARGPGRGLPELRGRSPTRWARQNSRGFSGVLSLGAWVPNNLARRKRKTRRLLTNRPCASLVYEESDSKERLRVSNWIVQRLYNDAVKKTVEL